MQPPSGGCVLKRLMIDRIFTNLTQPPSGGCVLKPQEVSKNGVAKIAATFGWLCVETASPILIKSDIECSHLRVAVC